MPRRNKPDQSINPDETLIALPPPRVVTGKGHGHTHEVDPYQLPPGAVPGRVSNMQTSQRPITRKQTKRDELARQEALAAERARVRRYTDYLQMRVEGKTQIEALAYVFSVSMEQAATQRVEFLAEVRTGIGGTELAEVLEQNDLTIQNRAAILSKWLYSDNPGASLKAADMIQELEGTSASQGSFESYLRLAKSQRSK